MRDRDPNHLHPLALMKKNQLETLAGRAGLPPLLLEETHRMPDLQDVDFAKGRDSAGNVIDADAIVTQARGGQSDHNFTRWIADPDAPEGWRLVPASLAWHFYIRVPDGGGALYGLGEFANVPEVRELYGRLGELAAGIDVRWGGDTNRNGKPFEPGERDLVHFSARPRGYTPSQVAAILEIRGGDLAWPRSAGRRA